MHSAKMSQCARCASPSVATVIFLFLICDAVSSHHRVIDYPEHNSRFYRNRETRFPTKNELEQNTSKPPRLEFKNPKDNINIPIFNKVQDFPSVMGPDRPNTSCGKIMCATKLHPYVINALISRAQKIEDKVRFHFKKQFNEGRSLQEDSDLRFASHRRPASFFGRSRSTSPSYIYKEYTPTSLVIRSETKVTRADKCNQSVSMTPTEGISTENEPYLFLSDEKGRECPILGPCIDPETPDAKAWFCRNNIIHKNITNAFNAKSLQKEDKEILWLDGCSCSLVDYEKRK